MTAEIIFEDAAYESAFLAGELDEPCALTLVARNSRLTSATTLHAAEETTRRFLARFADRPFSPEAVAFLSSELEPLFKKCGYAPDPDSPYEIIAFSPAQPFDPPEKPLSPGASLVYCGEGEGERYDFSLIEGGEDDGGCFLAVDGDTVLCAAGINDLGRDGYAEIYVECAEAYRRRGLGAACVAALSSRLLSEGQGVRYETTGDNTASIALAVSLGFREIERTVSFSAIGRNE